MAATVVVYSWNGGTDGSPTKATLPSAATRLKDADSNVVDGNDPVVIEGSVKYCFWKHISLNIASGGYTTIDNIRHSFPSNTWTLGTTGELRRGTLDAGPPHGCPEADYDIADGKYDIGVAVDGHGKYNSQTVKTFAVDGGETDMGIDAGPYNVNGPFDTDAIVFQVLVDTDATAGDQTNLTNTWKWDEI